MCLHSEFVFWSTSPPYKLLIHCKRTSLCWRGSGSVVSVVSVVVVVVVVVVAAVVVVVVVVAGGVLWFPKL